jgi:hypothetical protein
MGLWDTLMENFSNAPEWKGKRFEKFVIEKFSPQYFDIVDQTHSWQTNQERYVESSLNPDYTLRYRPTREKFAVECKYRSHLNPQGMLEYCKQYQLERYKKFMETQKIPVFIVVGLGGDDEDPNDLFVLPLKDMKYPSLYPSIYKAYSKNPLNNFYWKNGKLT